MWKSYIADPNRLTNAPPTPGVKRTRRQARRLGPFFIHENQQIQRRRRGAQLAKHSYCLPAMVCGVIHYMLKHLP